MSWKVISTVNRKKCEYYRKGGCANDLVDSRYCDERECILKADNEHIEDAIMLKAEQLYLEEERKALQQEDDLLDELNEWDVPF